MPEIKTNQDLAKALSKVAKSKSPLDDLKRGGFTFAGDLATLTTDSSRKPPVPDAIRSKLEPFAAKAGEVSVSIGPPAQPVPLLGPGDYDLVLSLRLSLADQILAGMYASFRIPHRLVISSLVDASTVTSALAIIKGEFSGVPADATMGDLLITGPPTLQEVAGTSQAALRVPIRLNILSASGGNKVLQGRLTLIAAVATNIDFARSAATFSLTLPPFPEPSHPSIEVDPGSIQPQSPQSAARFAAVLQLVLARTLSEQLIISPVITIPVTGALAVTLVVQQIDIRTNASAQGGFVSAGVRFAGATGSGNPNLLAGFAPAPSQNVFLRVDQRYLQRQLDTARQRGVLDQVLSDAQQANIKVRNVRVQFAQNEIDIIIDGTKVDACWFVDVDFTATQRFMISLQGGAISITSKTDVNVSTGDQVKCLVLAALTSLVVALPAFIVNPVLGIFFETLITGFIVDSFGSGGSGGGTSKPTLIDLTTPIPGTELLPTLTGVLTASQPGVLSANVTGGFRPDTVNTYVYARFLGSLLAGGGPLGTMNASPLRSAKVLLLDQDKPSPAGDDVNMPPVGETEKIGPKFITTTSVTYTPPAVDESLGQANTDFDGRVMFVLKPGAGKRAGTSTTTTITEPVHPSGHGGANDPQVRTQTKVVGENAPDLYFLVQAVNVNADTRKLANGIFVNSQVKRVGTPDQPVTYTVRVMPVATQ